jgi:hypothetical protein
MCGMLCSTIMTSSFDLLCHIFILQLFQVYSYADRSVGYCLIKVLRQAVSRDIFNAFNLMPGTGVALGGGED